MAKYTRFLSLVEANNEALEAMADLQAKTGGEYLFDRAYADAAFGRLMELGDAVASHLQDLSEGRHRALGNAMGLVRRRVEESLTERLPGGEGPLVLDLAAAAQAPPELVGGKVARLAEINGVLGLPVPPGFCVTTAACRRYMEQAGLREVVRREVEGLTLRDKAALDRASAAIQEAILGASWPREAQEKILGAYDALASKAGRSVRVSVRSSAVGEDGEFSFAGQFSTVLNVERDSLLRACQEVLASQFSPRALVYLKARGLDECAVPMAVGVFAMLDARASGVLYTRVPQDPAGGEMLVAASWGLGLPTVDGSADPDTLLLAREPEPSVREIHVASKQRMLLCKEGEGLVEVDVPGWMREESCLTRDQAAVLGRYGLLLERHYGRPQDVEWALDPSERIILLQSRPLRIAQEPRSGAGVVALRKGLAPLLRDGVVACRGCAAGEVFLLASEDDLPSVPPGSVLVAHAASPRLAEVVDRVAAIVTDTGSAASHLATVAREFGIPALFSTRQATALLKAGSTVTVDAEMGNVYEGRVEALLRDQARRPPAEETPLLRRVRAAMSHVVPLNLTDPRSPKFKPSSCKTLHDVLRFAHEAGVQEMFEAGAQAARAAREALKLEGVLPVDFFFVDLGGGLALDEGAPRLTPSAFRCRPLLPLWQGMAEVPWRTEAAATARAMGSLLMTGLTDRDAVARAAEPNYVLVSADYLNMSFRLGFHFSRVDAYLGERPEDSYAACLFHGGAAGAGGRSLRVTFLQRALAEAGFTTHAREDALFARTENAPPCEMEKRLRALGRLLVATRQIDTLLEDEAGVERALGALRRGDFTLGLLPKEDPS
jgi:pyruvate,water dikinase